MIKAKTFNQKGDTIVEVLVSMAILAVVLGTAFATTTRSFHSGLNAQARDQALLIAQQQVELLKKADSGPNPTIDNYKNQTGPFCVDPTDGSIIPLTSKPTCTAPINDQSNTAPFDLVDSYSSSRQTFTINVGWESENNRQQHVTIYYKASNSYVQ